MKSKNLFLSWTKTNIFVMESSVNSCLSHWLSDHSNPQIDPWKDPTWQDPSPLSKDSIPGDPTEMWLHNGPIEYDYTDTDSDDEAGVDGEEEEDEEFTWSGKVDSDGKFNGYGTVKFTNGDVFQGNFDHGIREHDGMIISPRNGVSSLVGEWRSGYLQGKGKMILDDLSVIEAWFRDGVMHGAARKVEMKKFRTFRQQVTWMGAYRNGRQSGQCWLWKEGGGYLTGKVNEEGKLTGDEIAFVYPDLETAIVGRFEDGVLVNGRASKIASVSLESGVMVPRFQPPVGESMVFSKSSSSDVGEGPLLEDPYEARTCDCQRSAVEGGGEGLFARREICQDEIVAFYNGVRLPYTPGLKEDWETSGYKIFINADYKSGERIDLPGDLIYTNNYCATLGHKMNHSFQPNCTEWFVDHPRFGIIPCAKATRPIAAGEEFFLHYGYDPLGCPPWYKEALEQFLEDNPDIEPGDAANPDRLVLNKTKSA